jgi:hypothetical protein
MTIATNPPPSTQTYYSVNFCTTFNPNDNDWLYNNGSGSSSYLYVNLPSSSGTLSVVSIQGDDTADNATNYYPGPDNRLYNLCNGTIYNFYNQENQWMMVTNGYQVPQGNLADYNNATYSYGMYFSNVPAAAGVYYYLDTYTNKSGGQTYYTYIFSFNGIVPDGITNDNFITTTNPTGAGNPP